MATNNKISFEVNGLTFEAPTDERRSPLAFKVGDRVKMLKKEYGDNYKAYPGVIVAIDLFKELPTVVVMYSELAYANPPELKFAYLNKASKDLELAPMCEEESSVALKEDVIELFQRAENELLQKVQDLRSRREFFLRKFGVAFGVAAREFATPSIPAEVAS
jgi:hypothetical protein